MSANVGKSTLALYRDCMRLVEHVAARTVKGRKIKAMVRNEFKRNMKVEDPEEVERLRKCAIDGLSNFLLHHGLSRLRKEKREEESAAAHARTSNTQAKAKGDVPITKIGRGPGERKGTIKDGKPVPSHSYSTMSTTTTTTAAATTSNNGDADHHHHPFTVHSMAMAPLWTMTSTHAMFRR